MIRQMEPEDLLQTAALEAECFSVPWSESALAEGLETRFDHYFVLEDGEGVSGYCALRILAGEGEILRIAVNPQKRGLGYGKKLMHAMVMCSRENGADQMILEVRAGNETALHLYRSYGFQSEGIRKGYYTNPTEDAVLMRLSEITSNSQ